MIQRGSGQESLTALRSPVLTGAGACGSLLVLEDGIPIRPVGICNVNELFEVNFEQAAAIEVLRGPGSVLYGSGADARHNQRDPADAAGDAVLASSLEGGPTNIGRGRLPLTHSGEATSSASRCHRDARRRLARPLRLRGAEAERGRGRDQGGRTVAAVARGTNLNQETAGFIQGFDSYRDEAIAKSNPNPEAYRDAEPALDRRVHAQARQRGVVALVRAQLAHGFPAALPDRQAGRGERPGRGGYVDLDAGHVVGELTCGLDPRSPDGLLKTRAARRPTARRRRMRFARRANITTTTWIPKWWRGMPMAAPLASRWKLRRRCGSNTRLRLRQPDDRRQHGRGRRALRRRLSLLAAGRPLG